MSEKLEQNLKTVNQKTKLESQTSGRKAFFAKASDFLT